MSSTTPQPSGNVLVIAIAAMFVCVIVSATLLVMAVEDGARVESMVVIMLSALTTTIAALATLAQVNAVRKQVDFLANGGTDSKVRAAVADVLRHDLIREDAAEQLAVDRVVRERVPPAVVEVTPTA